MALKEAVRERIMNEVIHPVKSRDWKVLVLDHASTRILSSCCKMTEVMSEGITLVEDLNKKREPLRSLEAIYLIMPCEKSIGLLMDDFLTPEKTLYKHAHVFFTEDDLFTKLCKSSVARFIKTLKEINIAFLPYESQVFSLDTPELFQLFYSPNQAHRNELERCAEQIATLCATLGEYPSIRYRGEWERNPDFALLVQQKLNAYKADDHTMGQGPGKERSQLIILDRGFDPVSPLLHELTMQALAYDVLNIENDVYRFETSSGSAQGEKEVLLDENDDIWCELRHQHIAVASQQVTKKMKEFAESKHVRSSDKASVRELSQLIKKMPQYRKELSCYSTHLTMAEACMEFCKQPINKTMCKVEQDMVMGTDPSGEKIKDPMRSIVPILLDKTLNEADKTRIIMLYIIHKGGISDESLDKLCQHAQLSADYKSYILSLQNLGVTVLQDSSRHKYQQNYLTLNRRERVTEHAYDLSRWIPYVKDIMEEAIEDKLNPQRFPFLSGGSRAAGLGSAPVSARYGQWHRDRPGQAGIKSGPRLIIFIIGGMSYSEMRCAYEVSHAVKNWEVIIGSTHILTPKGFVYGLATN